MIGEANRDRPFNTDWRFYRGDAPGAEQPGFDDSAWRTLDVPHDWSIEDLPEIADQDRGGIWTEGTNPTRVGPFDLYASEGQAATGWVVGGVGWYRKTFNAPKIPPSGKAEIRFEGVYMNSDVWLNGTLLGNHPYGYTGFTYNLTPYLTPGTNIIAVRAKSTGQNSRWYSGSGIFRKVSLNVVGALRIVEHGIRITTPEVSKDTAQVKLEVSVESGAAIPQSASIRIRLRDSTRRVVAEYQATATVAAASRTVFSAALTVKNPDLWSPSDPQLYRAEVLVELGRKPVDFASIPFGIRKVQIDAARGLRINDETIKLHGGCLHHDNGSLGSACIPRAEERRVELLKANGFNAVRTSHNPPSRDFLDACDRLGMLVIDEAFDCWTIGKNPEDYHLYFKEWWKRDLESLVLRDLNHPSVIFWSIGNEIPERAEPTGVEIGKQLAGFIRQLDPTRPITAAICGPWDHPKQTWADMQTAFTYLDVGGYNYQWKSYASDHESFPERVMMGTESFPNEAFQNWSTIETSSYVIGDFVWTAMDYLGESGIGNASLNLEGGASPSTRFYPWFNSYCGDIDLIGNKKPQSYYRDVVWGRSKIEIAVQRPIPAHFTEQISKWGWSDELRSWTWPELLGSPIRVRVYTRGDEVKLFLNRKQVGHAQISPQDALTAQFDVPYSPGELRAVAFEKGKEIAATQLATVGPMTRVVLAPDRAQIQASRDDLAYVIARVVDGDSRTVPDAVVPVTFSVSGAGELLAVGNANPKDVASFRQPRRSTFHGVCLAVLRPTGEPGTIVLKAEAPGLPPVTIEVKTA
ncbi:MAG: glycoside hydrolase family 2 TIM barrel-domain containing protein [Terracidiphilus sp.]